VSNSGGRKGANDTGIVSDRFNPNIDECFPTDLRALAHGKIKKAFCKPLTFRFGSQFKNKSEEARFNKVSDQILKLRHLLINDP